MMPRPPSVWGRITVCQATRALEVPEPSEPDQRKFRTNLLSWATQDLEKHQQEATYQAVAKRTWLTTRALPARERQVVLQKASFRRMEARTGKNCCAGEVSSPT